MPRNPATDDPEIHRHRDGPCGAWTEKEKRFLHSLLFYVEPTLAGLKAAADELYLAFPDAHQYKGHSLSNYLNSSHFRDDQNQLIAEVRETVPKSGFSVRELRLHALNDHAECIHRALALIRDDQLIAKATPASKLLGEFRLYLTAIREEIARIGGSADEKATSVAEHLAEDERRLKEAEASKESKRKKYQPPSRAPTGVN